MTKKIQVEFANKVVKDSDHFKNVKEAVMHSSVNLRYRHKVEIKDISVNKMGLIILEIGMPENAEDFSFGNHLRGISAYLLRRNPEIYKELLVGKRLLNYNEEFYDPDDESSFEGFKDNSAANFVLAYEFMKLLNSYDKKSIEKVSRIQEIIYE